MPREKENWDPRSVWLDHRYHNSGQWTDAGTGKKFTPKQHYYVGGNTKVYGAILFRFRERDFGDVTHVDGVSPSWPIAYAELEPYYTRAERAVPGARRARHRPDRAAVGVALPLPRHQRRAPHRPALADLQSVGLHPFPLPNGILMNETAPEISACVRCATCDGYPCLVNGKADAQTIAVVPALRHPNVTLLTNAS